MLIARINGEIRKALSARHGCRTTCSPIASVPRTLSGKKLEVPVKKLLLGQPVEKVINKEAMANPACLDWYLAFARDYLARNAA